MLRSDRAATTKTTKLLAAQSLRSKERVHYMFMRKLPA